MKKYTVHLNYYATIDVDVLANSEEEAKMKAENMDKPSSQFFFTHNASEILDAEDIVDLPVLIEQAENLLKDYEEDNPLDIDIEEPLRLDDHNYYNGDEDIHYEYVESVWLSDEITFYVEDGGREYYLSELKDVDQFRLCNAIIEKGGQNG